MKGLDGCAVRVADDVNNNGTFSILIYHTLNSAFEDNF